MKGHISRRPSPAFIVAILALVMATAGTGYAAFKVPSKSVGTNQLKANAVTTGKIKKEAVNGKKIKKGTITGANLNLAQLGTVPSATTATTATVANSLAPVEAPHIVGAAGEPPFENGAKSGIEGFPFNSGPVLFYKDHEGIVHLEGIVEAGTSPFVFTLPPGFRPAAGTMKSFDIDGIFVLVGGTGTNFEGEDFSGKVVTFEGVGFLDGITFRAGS